VNLIFFLAAQYDLELESLDIKTAFLYSFLREDIYLKRPKGVGDDLMPPIVKLNKCLYGLKQAAFEWKNNIHTTLIALGFTQLLTDRCVYIKRNNDGVIIIGLHVDDLLVATSNHELTDRFNLDLSKFYEISINDPLDSYLGMQITRDRECRTITISQPGYVSRILTKFNVRESHVSTPMKIERELNSNDIELFQVLLNDEDKLIYQSKVGAVNYLAVKTRPNLAYSISNCSTHLQSPTQLDMLSIDHILEYIRSTQNFGITFRATDHDKLYA
jgi:hypothetical protein